MTDAVDEALVRLAREESGRVLALLARRFGNLDLADDAVQEALVEANDRWRTSGIPANPAGWLMTVASRKAIDQLRRAEVRDRRSRAIAAELAIEPESVHDEEGETVRIEPDERVTDERLRLIFLCCHPAIEREAQVALTLRLVAGLTTPEIAAAFVVPEATLAQRIVRAKRKIRVANIPMSLPIELAERIDAVLEVLYLVFNEGYLSRSGSTDALQRIDLATEAIRLTEILHELLPEIAEVKGLLALELFDHARAATRADEHGDLVLLEAQDRSCWDLAMITRANGILADAMRRMQPGHYQLHALIGSYHANARTSVDTDWPAIVGLYRQLHALSSSPVAALNHAVAVAMADGPHAGLALVDRITELNEYYLFHAARADLLRRLDRAEEARTAYDQALERTANPAERRFLVKRLAELPE